MTLLLDAGFRMPDLEDLRTEAIAPPAASLRRDYGTMNDLDLMRLIGAGNREAFAVFCRRHAGRCLSIALHLLRNEADAEEAVQDAFMRVWQNADRWRATEARVTTWLYKVVVNLCLDQMRKATRLSVSLDHAIEIMTTDPNPESLVGQRELAQVIVRAVAALPPRQRAALSLVVCEGMECAEAARIMGVTVGTMESLLVRGRRHLRTVLTEATQERLTGGKSAKTASDTTEIALPMGALPGFGG
jgi:RNA polymerase sigma-70 factor (ECF subfamily)